MGWTVAVGMVTSLPFLIFSGPITDSIGHMNVIVIGNIMIILRTYPTDKKVISKYDNQYIN